MQTKIKTELLTSEILKNYSISNGKNVYETIEYAKSKYKKYPVKPPKPYLKVKHSAEDAKEYASLLLKYEEENKNYNEECALVRHYNLLIDAAIEAYIKEEAELNLVPEKSRDKVYALAYEQGHSDGYYEVYQKLSTLIDLFI